MNSSTSAHTAEAGAQMGTEAKVTSGTGALSPTIPLGVQFNVHKAGLGSLKHADQIAQVVAEAARGGRFYNNEVRKESELVAHIDFLRSKALTIPKSSSAADSVMAEIEAQRPSSHVHRVIVCVDFDCFFAAVEALDNPSLRGKPHAVGGGTNGVLSTSSYEARAFGVRSAMPLFIAKKLCPQLIVVPTRFHRYEEISQLVSERVFAEYDPNFEMCSLDEAFLDITDYVALSQTEVSEVVTDLRNRVRNVTGGLTVSCGIASNRLLAKIGADVNKPDGQFVAPSTRDGIIDFMSKLPVRKIPGIGRVTERILKDVFDITSVGQIIEHRGYLYHVLRPKTFHFLLSSALGISSNCVDGRSTRAPKGMSRERTFRSLSDRESIRTVVHELCKLLSADVTSTGGRVLGGKSIGVKLKQKDFRVRCRSRKFQTAIGLSATDLENAAWALIEAELPIEVRLLGVRLSDLVGPGVQDGPEFDRMDSGQVRIDRFFETRTNSVLCAVSGSSPLISTRSEVGIDRNEIRKNNVVEDVVCAQDSKTVLMECPVCCRSSFSSLLLLNRHIDKCLMVNSGETRPVKTRRKVANKALATEPQRQQFGIEGYLGL